MTEIPQRNDGHNDHEFAGDGAGSPMPAAPRLSAALLVRKDERDGGPASGPAAVACLVCSAPRLGGRGRYCSAACRQRAFRLRHTALPGAEEGRLRTALQRRKQLTEHTIYECPTCDTRYLGERRCADCNRFCRAVGLGGACSACDEPVLLSDLLDLEV